MMSRGEMEDAYGYVCDCSRHDHIDDLCSWCRDRRNDQLQEQEEEEREMELEAKIEKLEAELLFKASEIAEFKMKNVELRAEVATLRSYVDRVECHLRDAKSNIVLLMSKIQEYEARQY